MMSSRDPLSPPPSPINPFSDDVPALLTDERGMLLEDGQTGEGQDFGSSHVHAVTGRQRRPRKKKQPITYVSRHFSQDQDGDGRDAAQGSASTSRSVFKKGRRKKESGTVESSLLATPPATPAKSATGGTGNHQLRIYYGLNVDDLSSDSDLTDVPDDIGPDPFAPLSELVAVKQKQKRKSISNHPTKSPYFPGGQHAHRPRSHFLSTLPFPPLSAERFGLMQERLAHDPFRLLIATIFLNKTPGERAMPVFYRLMKQYANPKELAGAEVADITAIIQKLGFQNQRARKIVSMAKKWIEASPEEDKRYGKRDYPRKGDARNVKDGEILDQEDERVGWEISHLPGIGAYAHDSWRMFCRDMLLGRADGWNGEGATEDDFEPEWKRVLPLDKELRAWMTWMWLKEGWVWNKETGEKEKASEELMAMAQGGGVVVEEREKNTLTVQKMEEEKVLEKEVTSKVEIPAGEFLEKVEAGVVG